MSKRKKLKYTLLLLLIVIILSSCSTTKSYNNCAVYPSGGKAVGTELEKIPYVGYENFWE